MRDEFFDQRGIVTVVVMQALSAEGISATRNSSSAKSRTRRCYFEKKKPNPRTISDLRYSEIMRSQQSLYVPHRSGGKIVEVFTAVNSNQHSAEGLAVLIEMQK